MPAAREEYNDFKFNGVYGTRNGDHSTDVVAIATTGVENHADIKSSGQHPQLVGWCMISTLLNCHM